ncbi:MAG: sugar phosphate nucleotidyltransferase [Acidobacteriota bacterium]|nr:sugar phosphate nucleotidyltransferase [Acidobacteriota bacterium]MDE2963679.1 sugar phosphate nucleotidyltransferase [Acidobacteriota bacterium]
MKAMILAAGRGTRLGPLGLQRPKALLEIQGIPLLAGVISRLAQQGFREIIVNTHHLADQVAEYLTRYRQSYRPVGLTLAVSREEDLLDTGGGVQRAGWFFDDGQPFLVYNVDVLSDLHLGRLLQAHLDSEALATLAVHQRKSSRRLLFDSRDVLCGWQSLATGQERMARSPDGPLTPLSFMGIQVISPALLDRLTLSPPFSLVDAYLQAASLGLTVRAHRSDEARWADLGSLERLKQAEELFEPAFFASLRKGP